MASLSSGLPSTSTSAKLWATREPRPGTLALPFNHARSVQGVGYPTETKAWPEAKERLGSSQDGG